MGGGGFSRSEPFIFTVDLQHNGPAVKGETCDLRSGLVIRQKKQTIKAASPSLQIASAALICLLVCSLCKQRAYREFYLELGQGNKTICS